MQGRDARLLISIKFSYGQCSKCADLAGMLRVFRKQNSGDGLDSVFAG